MEELGKGSIKALVASGVGALTGVGAYSLWGGVGVAVGGTAVGLTLGSFAAVGAGAAGAGYGLYCLGRKAGETKRC